MKNDIQKHIGLQFLISGRVQGVFYRRFAKQSAEALDITGWTRNLPDGQVEVHAFGTEIQLLSYQDKLRQGPLAANVKDIVIQTIEWENHPYFQIYD